MATALTIAGSDSGAGAGIQADLKTFAALGVYGTCAITAITAQNTKGVMAVHALPADLVTAQIEAVVSDIGANAAKTGMLPNAAIVEVVGAAVEDLEIPLLVVDPVMVAKSGDRLVDDEAVGAIRSELLRRAHVVTPNIAEAEVLAQMRITSDDDRREAARRIHKLGAAAVVVKGGHYPSASILDLLYDGHRFTDFETARVEGTSLHGTGCTFASALAAFLARGRTLAEALPLAQEYVAGGIRHARPIGGGHGPLNHFWRVQ